MVGIDDHQATLGSVVFSVRDQDERVLAGPTATLGAKSAPVTLTADVTGVTTLVLIADATADGNGNDWSDWADATVTCSLGDFLAVPALSLSPTSVEAGASLDVEVEGFIADSPEGEPVRIVVASSGEELGRVSIGEDGRGSARITVPSSTPAGSFAVAAIQKEGDTWRTARSTVKVLTRGIPSPDPSADPSIAPSADPSHTPPASSPGTSLPSSTGQIAADGGDRTDHEDTGGHLAATGLRGGSIILAVLMVVAGGLALRRRRIVS